MLVRDDLIKFLKADSEARNATIVCKSSHLSFQIVSINYTSDATHIFDGLDDFPTHIAHMRSGTFVTPPTLWPTPTGITISKHDAQMATLLYRVALDWMRDDRDHRCELERQGKKRRGARAGKVKLEIFLCPRLTLVQGVPTDSETFYKKCVCFVFSLGSVLTREDTITLISGQSITVLLIPEFAHRN